MTPLKLKYFLSQHKTVSLLDISNAFNISMELATELIRFWMKRGYCIEIQSCESCQLCDRLIYYQWKTECVESS